MKEVVRTNFDASVSAYEAYERRTGRFRALARLLDAEMRARHGSPIGRVLDAGAGTGASTRELGAENGHVLALDASREMLRACDTGDPIQSDIDRLPLAGNSVDGVAFTASLFLVPDPAVAAREVSHYPGDGCPAVPEAAVRGASQAGAGPAGWAGRHRRTAVAVGRGYTV